MTNSIVKIGLGFVLVALSSCGSPCRQGTLFLTLNLDSVTAAADRLDIQVTVAGKLEESVLPHSAGAVVESFEVDFSPSYPAGQNVAVAVVALRNGDAIGGGTAMAALASSCDALSLSLSAGQFTDGGVGDQGAAQDSGNADFGPAGAHNIVFRTSTLLTPAQLVAMGNGDPIAGGDLLCNQRAVAAKLPGHYVAFLSDAKTTAASRLTGARGWVRPDGLPFADSLESLLLQPQVFYPPTLDELGFNQGQTGVMTAATSSGGLASAACMGWAMLDDSAEIASGIASAGSAGWDDGGELHCDEQLGVYCFGVDSNQPLTFAPAKGRLAFASTLWSPGGGLGGADAWCAMDAAASHLPGTYKALLPTDSATAASRFDLSLATWVRPDGVMVAMSPFALIAQSLLAPIDLAADGKTYFSDDAWTGAGSLTTPAMGSSCSNWTDGTADQTVDRAPVWDSVNFFSAEDRVGCNTPAHIYCLQE